MEFIFSGYAPPKIPACRKTGFFIARICARFQTHFPVFFLPRPLCHRRIPLKPPNPITFPDLKKAAAPPHPERTPLLVFPERYACLL